MGLGQKFSKRRLGFLHQGWVTSALALSMTWLILTLARVSPAQTNDLIRRFNDEPLEATGKKEIEVRQTLDRELRKLLLPYVAAAEAAQAEYQRTTAVGTLPDVQAAARQEQRETLKKLAATAAKLEG